MTAPDAGSWNYRSSRNCSRPRNLKLDITFLYFSGGRFGEGELIEWSQVDLERKLIRIEDDQTKDKEAREIPLPRRLVLMLERIEPKQRRVFDTTNVRKQWAKACAATGLGRIIAVEGRPYDHRYEGEKVAMEITVRKTRSVFDRYHIVDTQDVSNAMQQWEAVASQNLLSQTRGSKLGKSARQSHRKSLRALSSRG